MKADGHDELDRALEHLESLPRATPPPNLLRRIEERIAQAEVKVISLPQWRMIAAAAAVVLGLNVYALTAYANGNNSFAATNDYDDASLISNYELYE